MIETERKTPQVGTRVTLVAWSDRRAYTVIAVSASGCKITLQRCSVKLLNGLGSGCPDELNFQPGGFSGTVNGEQRWEIKDDPKGEIIFAHLRKDGRYYSGGDRIAVNGGREFYDYNF